MEGLETLLSAARMWMRTLGKCPRRRLFLGEYLVWLVARNEWGDTVKSDENLEMLVKLLM